MDTKIQYSDCDQCGKELRMRGGSYGFIEEAYSVTIHTARLSDEFVLCRKCYNALRKTTSSLVSKTPFLGKKTFEVCKKCIPDIVWNTFSISRKSGSK